MSVKFEGLDFSEANFGINFEGRMDIWTGALNRIFKDLKLPVKAKVERYVDDAEHLPVHDRIKIRVERI